jgi:hypothetical protein
MIVLQLKSLYILLKNSVLNREYWTYRNFKKFEKDYNNKEAIKLISKYSFAIIVQGAVIDEDDFTFESLKIYRRNFPEAILILSTWNVSVDLEMQLNEYKVNVIRNQRPSNPGISNINLQIKTSRSGVLLAKELGSEFVLKTRTDQRIYHPSLDAYLISLIRAFPLKNNRHTDQSERMVAISLNTFKHRLYGISDMFLFGHIDDMCKYWDAPFDNRIDSLEEAKKAGKTWQSFSNWRVCEVYLCANFIEGLGRELTFTLQDYHEVLKEHFIIIDQSAIKLFWKKYNLSEDRYAAFGVFDPEISFNDWLVLFQASDNIILNAGFMNKIR